MQSYSRINSYIFNMISERSTSNLQQKAGFYQPKQQNHQPYKTLFFITLTAFLLLCAYTVRSELSNKTGVLSPNPELASRTMAEGDDIEIKEVPTAPAISTQKIDVAKNTTKLYNFPLSEKSNVSIVFLTCCLRHDMLEETLLAFLELNEYPFKKLIVVNDGPSNRQVDEITEKFANMTMLSTGDKGGQLRAIDEAMKLVDTPYVFYSQDDFKPIKSGLITEDIQQLEKDPHLLQMWNAFHAERFVNGTNIVDPSWIWGGFSFQPSVWRMSDYHLIKGGFANLTKDASRGMGAGVEEVTIIRQFKSRGYYVKQSATQYNVHLGNGRRLPRKN